MRTNKDIIKGILIGVIITSFVFCSIFAAPVKKTIEVLFSDIQIAIDGKLLDLKDATGKQLQPIVYNGTTYLPIRAVATALGKDITPPKDDNILYIGKVIKPNGRLVGVSELTPNTKSKMMIGTAWEQGKKLKIANMEYELLDAITCNGIGAGGSGSIDYALNGGYSKITGSFGVDDSSPNPVGKKITEAGAVLQIIGDGNVLYETPIATKDSSPSKIDVDIIGVKLLSIKIADSNKSSEYRYRYDFINVKITKNAE